MLSLTVAPPPLPPSTVASPVNVMQPVLLCAENPCLNYGPVKLLRDPTRKYCHVKFKSKLQNLAYKIRKGQDSVRRRMFRFVPEVPVGSFYWGKAAGS